MAGSGKDVRAGKAFVELYVKNSRLMKGLKDAQQRIRDFGNGIATTGKWMMGIGMAAAVPLSLFAKVASDANESLNKFNAVFGASSKSVYEWSESLAKAVGRSAVDIREAASIYQSFFVGLGFANTKATGLSKTMSQLAIDFASFFNISDEEATQRFIAAMSGSSEVLDKFGVNIKQAALEAQLAAMGITKAWSKVTEQEKAMARIAVIQKAMTGQGAVGDAQKTADLFANILRAIGSAAKDFTISIGSVVVSVVEPYARALRDLIRATANFIGSHEEMVKTIVKVVGAVTVAGGALLSIGYSIVFVGTAIGGLHSIIMWATGGIQLLVGVFSMLASPIGLAVAAVAALSAGFIYLFRNTAFIQSIGTSIYSYLQSIWKGFSEIFGELSAAWDGIVAAVSAGNLSAAMSVITATVKLEWTRLMAWFSGIWTSLQNEWTTLTSGFQILFVQAVAGIKTAWASAVGYMAKLWEQWKASTFTEGFADLIAPIFAAIQGVDVKDVRDQLHKDFARQRNELPQQQAQIDADTNARKTQIEKDRQDSESEIAARAQKTTSDRNNAIQDAQNDLDAAKKAQKAAIDAAHESKRQEEEKRASGKYTPPGQPESIDIGAMKAAKDSITGTFSGRALSGMGGGIQERIAKATEAAAKRLEQLHRIDTDMLREQRRLTLEATA